MKEGSSEPLGNIMKRRVQGYNDRLDESLGSRNPGKHIQSFKDRRDESKAMEKKDTGHAYAGNKSADKAYENHMKYAHHKYMAAKARKEMKK